MTCANPTDCKEPDCRKPEFARGWCMKHYSRWRRHGDPKVAGGKARGASAIPFENLIDRSSGPDACWPWLGYVNPRGYGWWGHDWRKETAHREMWRRTVGEPP